MTAYGAPRAFLERALTLNSNECLPWPYAKNPSGHARVRLDGRTYVVSRVICERAHGPPPVRTMDAAHSCGNAGCVNPRHIRWATRSENHMDKVGHGTHNRGDRNPQALLTEEQVNEIRLLVTFSVTDAAIAKRYGVAKRTVNHIRNRDRWSWLP